MCQSISRKFPCHKLSPGRRRILRSFMASNISDFHFHSFRCHICDEEFIKMCYLSIHTRTVHDCTPKVVCQCGKFLATAKTLLMHYESHFKNSKFRCDECKKKFKTEANYSNHMATYHRIGDGEPVVAKVFECKECGKSFKQARHLMVHKNSHLPDELKFVNECSFCGKRYSSVFSLRQHIKHVHVRVCLESMFSCRNDFISSFALAGANVPMSALPKNVRS